jgi:diguanylate cyclase (GGDEF)-like protein
MGNPKQDAKSIAGIKMTVDLAKSIFSEKGASGYERERLEKVRNAHGNEIYAEALYIITNTRIQDTKRAKRLIGRINRHRKKMKNMLGRDVGLQVAALDYMQNKEGILKNPTLIERRKVQKLAEHAITDDFIHVYDKSVLFIDIEEEAERSKRYGSVFSIIMLDIDNFKQLNDFYGHMIGDNILCSVAETLQKNVRKTDTVYRYGGDEFVILLPETGREHVGDIAEKIKELTEDVRFNGVSARVHLSMGVATFAHTTQTGKDLLHDADRALYKAKESGKNKIFERTTDGFEQIIVGSGVQ